MNGQSRGVLYEMECKPYTNAYIYLVFVGVAILFSVVLLHTQYDRMNPYRTVIIVVVVLSCQKWMYFFCFFAVASSFHMCGFLRSSFSFHSIALLLRYQFHIWFETCFLLLLFPSPLLFNFIHSVFYFSFS